MPTSDCTVNNWREFLDYIERFVPEPSNPYGSMGFRGQERSTPGWRLQPSLARQLPGECDLQRALKIERLLLLEFRQDGHRNLANWEIPDPHNRYQLLGWLMAMQQYGAPTRLLDWTFSPYVAAYFAVREAPEVDGALWVLNYEELVRALQVPPKTKVSLDRVDKALAGEVETPCTPPGICAVFQKMQRPERMYAQQGFYMVCEDPRRAHDEVMAEIATKAHADPFLHRVIIPSEAKEQFLANLRMMNITGASLFPGADGLGRHVAEWGRLLAGGLAKMPAKLAAEDSANESPE